MGSYLDRSGNARGLLLTESAGKWGPGVEASLPANAAGGGRFAVSIGPVSCASPGNCSAVGSYTAVGSAYEQGLLLTETAGVWAIGVEAAPPANAATGVNQGVDLYSVSCPSAGNCSAVGNYRNNSSGSDGLLLTETAGTWATGVEAAPPGNVATQHLVGLSAVSCASTGNCAAIGGYVDESDNKPGLLLTETDGTWTAGVEAPLPANAVTTQQFVDLGSISCASAGNCSAVGAYNIGLGRDGAGSEGLLLTETAGTWATGVEATLPANSGMGDIGEDDVRLGPVSCASAGDCAAAGAYFDNSGNGHGMLLTETAGSWSDGIEAALPANATKRQYVEINSISCASAGNCSAVGAYRTYINSGNFVRHGLLLTQRAGRWGHGAEATLPFNATKSPYLALTAVSCPSAQDCGAVGAYGVPHGSLEGLLLTRSATPTPCLVPRLEGETLSAATHTLQAHDCSLGKVTHARSRTVKKGRVISQKPKPGTQLKHEARIHVVVSTGRRR